MSALEHPASPAGDADADASVAGPAAVRPRRSSWELLLWILSAALVASGAALLWQASADGSFDTAQPVSTIRMDPETGRVISCESQGGPCSWTLATDGLAYALALPALGSGTTGLLLGIALRARRTTQQQPESQSHLHPQPQPQHERSALPQKAPAQPEQLLRPRDARATPPSPRSLRDGTTASFAPFMPPGQQPDDDPARR
ncbi:hypothetical protein [Frigoribacterium sp. VKM Ac-2530]|uniref:hypothetical protein n=1 Tax=Frigoribacterium sp. VKM Ac-2530 TaxID=2783822 RepID=UPI00188C21D8|nr:hypothetical protein [Frigoribacterium sp. VKM Ac-2530]MBF4579594.1 hypothetical protein [Frigoribacterium sp. VKM Ac-2530]